MLKNKPLKIVKVTAHCCIRVLKEALPLLDRGYDVHVITQKEPALAGKYSSVSRYHTPMQLRRAILNHADADLFHCHNEPNWFVTAIKQELPKTPVILDVHDSHLIRVEPDDWSQVRISVDERNNMQLADGLVFVSKGLARACRTEFRLDQPYVILPSYVPRDMYRYDIHKWMGGVVYEGRVDLPEKVSKPEHKFWSYCDYTGFAQACFERGIDFHIYAPGDHDKMMQAYGDIAFYHGGLSYDKMIRAIGRHDWGLVGNLDSHLDWENALPNKLFEYVAAGVPVVALHAAECSEYIDKTSIGMTITDLDDLRKRWPMHRYFRNNLIKIRGKMCMEEHLEDLEKLYRELT